MSGASGYTTYYIGNYYEVKDPVSGNNVITKYYYFDAQRVAMKVDATTYYIRGDHLGSSSVVLDNAGAVYARRTYYPYGETRTQQNNAMPTDFTFTGQRYDVGELMDYGAREYDIVHAQFVQPDSIVPDLFDPQSLNRYAYVSNNPVRYTDPTGHMMDDGLDGGGGGDGTYSGPQTDDRPYCEKYPYSYGCYTPSLPATNDGAPNTDSGGGGVRETDGDCDLSCQDGRDPSEKATSLAEAQCARGSSGCPFFPDFKPPGSLSGPWTISFGYGAVAEAIFGVQVDGAVINLDSNGTLQAGSVSIGGRMGTGFGAAGDIFVMVTNAKSVDDLAGWSVNAGGAAGLIAVDAVWGQNHVYDGLRMGVGAHGTVTVIPNPSGPPIPVPAEIHAGASYTFMTTWKQELW